MASRDVRAPAGLIPTKDPDRTERVDPPAECREFRADLASGTELADGWAQVWDVLPAVVNKVHDRLPRRKCGCGLTTPAAPPFGRAGTVSYGPNLAESVEFLIRSSWHQGGCRSLRSSRRM